MRETGLLGVLRGAGPLAAALEHVHAHGDVALLWSGLVGRANDSRRGRGDYGREGVTDAGRMPGYKRSSKPTGSRTVSANDCSPFSEARHIVIYSGR